MNAICDTMEGEFLKEPQKEDWELIAEEFKLKWSFPMCVGAIDGNVNTLITLLRCRQLGLIYNVSWFCLWEI